MNELKSHLPKSVVLMIILGIFAITVSGYVLFFQSQKRILSKDREYELLKEKEMHSQENYSDLQKKYNSTAEQLKQLSKDYETTAQKQQECKEKQEELQVKYDELSKSNEKISQELQQIKGHTGPTSPSSIPSKPENEKTNKTSLAPAEKDKVLSSSVNNIPKSTSPPILYHCPASDIVTKNVSNGSWTDNQLTWFVDYVSRPLSDNETINQLFKILFDGQTIACYYELGTEANGAAIVIKGSTKANKISIADRDGWTSCPTQDCQSLCANDSLSRCHFTLHD